MLALWTIVTFLRPAGDGVFEGELQQTAAALAGVDAGGHRDRVRIVVDLNVVLVADVQSLEVLAHHHEVDVVEAAARNERARGAQIGVQLEFLAQADVGRAVAAARRRLERPLQGEARAADAVDGGRRQRILRRFHSLHAGRLPVPLKRRPQRIEDGKRGVDDLGADPVSGDQRGGDRLSHRRGSHMAGAKD